MSISIKISTGKNRYEKKWKNTEMSWDDLTAKLATPVVTPEHYAEYKKMAKSDQDNIKDVGGFVGGHLKGGHRKADSVECRQIITLDLDFAPLDFFDGVEMIADYAACVYSTHKHSTETPRFRMLIPLNRTVSGDEYEAIARKVADTIGMDYFDDTTFQASRLMYWPSRSTDGEYYYKNLKNPPLDADKILSEYTDWTDTSYWPESSRAAERRKKTADKQGDPCQKNGLIGAFCRTYTVPEAITEFISDRYTECATPDRYTYINGSTAAGLVIYEGGKFAYSNHGTDPISGLLCNAFDLVRIHKFGSLDEDVNSRTDTTKLPSYKAMTDLARSDANVKITLANERKQKAEEDFSDTSEYINWQSSLTLDKQGNIEGTITNLITIIKHDEGLKGLVYNRLADSIEVLSDVPWKRNAAKFWRDADDAQLVSYVETVYGSFSARAFDVSVSKVADDRNYHPIEEYLEALPEWDGTERVDSLFIDYLGAEDNEYVRAATRKALVAAVARINHPGIKFDYMVVLDGPQGIGKSTLISKLGGSWFSDSLSLDDTHDKTAAEKLQGYWILEIPELNGLKKTDIDTLKNFISKQNDIYRAAFGRRPVPHMRQCIFIGTTNANGGYLRDTTGNRRFWPIRVNENSLKHPWDITQEEILQIWAEAKVYFGRGEKLYLENSNLEEALKAQEEAKEVDPRQGIIENYLNTLLPEDWNDRDIYKRREFLRSDEFESEKGTVERTRVCIAEIWCECFGKEIGSLRRQDSNELASVVNSIKGWEKFEGTKKFGKNYGAAKGWFKVTNRGNQG